MLDFTKGSLTSKDVRYQARFLTSWIPNFKEVSLTTTTTTTTTTNVYICKHTDINGRLISVQDEWHLSRTGLLKSVYVKRILGLDCVGLYYDWNRLALSIIQGPWKAMLFTINYTELFNEFRVKSSPSRNNGILLLGILTYNGTLLQPPGRWRDVMKPVCYLTHLSYWLILTIRCLQLLNQVPSAAQETWCKPKFHHNVQSAHQWSPPLAISIHPTPRHPSFLKSILMLSSYLCLDLRVCLCLSFLWP
jgi:hypothetical protein